METAAFLALALACAPAVHVDTAHALVKVESSLNPWAVGVVGGELQRQPRSRAEALATAAALQSAGWDFSVGLGQINVRNFARLGLTLKSAFEPCSNLAAMQALLSDCFERATSTGHRAQHALRQALSCYYSGDFSTGFQQGYVQRVVQAATGAQPLLPPNSPEGEVMKRIARPQRAIPAHEFQLALALLAATPAFAGGFDKINDTVTNVNTILVTVSIAVVTIAIIRAGFKMIFQGARLADVANVLIGGTLIGGAGAMAAYIVN